MIAGLWKEGRVWLSMEWLDWPQCSLKTNLMSLSWKINNETFCNSFWEAKVKVVSRRVFAFPVSENFSWGLTVTGTATCGCLPPSNFKSSLVWLTSAELLKAFSKNNTPEKLTHWKSVKILCVQLITLVPKPSKVILAGVSADEISQDQEAFIDLFASPVPGEFTLEKDHNTGRFTRKRPGIFCNNSR